MKNFWVSLFVFILLLCSCKSKKVVSDVGLRSNSTSETAYLNENVRIDTTETAYSIQVEQIKRIVETIIETEYDTDKNVVKKVTETERTIEQDIKADVVEEGKLGITESSRDSLNHFADVSKKVDSEVKEESEGLNEKIGKWTAVGISCIIGIIIVYLKMKLRDN